MNQSVDKKSILIFLGFAFGIAWLTGLVIYLTGGLANTPRIIFGLPLAGLLLATTYMWAPALANIFTRIITRQGFANAGLRPYIRHGWPYWVAAWLLPSILTILGAVLFFLIYPQYYAGTSTLRTQLQAAGQTVPPGSLWPIIIIQTAAAVLISPPINGLFTFGEEFGWRGYLLPKLTPLGTRRAVLLLGVIWGIWHWPVIVMGYEYGFDYPGFPWLGMLLFLLFTISAGTLLAWVTYQGRSIWPAVIGHGAINGIAAIAALFTSSNPKPLSLLGPLPVGIIGMAGYLLLALVIILLPQALMPREPSRLPYPQEAEEARLEPQM